MAACRRSTRKYNNTPVDIDGYRFDSTAEVKFYRLVEHWDRRDILTDWSLHPRYEIVPTQKPWGYTWRKGSYSPDYVLAFDDGRPTEAIEVKGARCIITPDSRIRMKLFQYQHPEIRLRIWTPREGFLF